MEHIVVPHNKKRKNLSAIKKPKVINKLEKDFKKFEGKFNEPRKSHLEFFCLNDDK